LGDVFSVGEGARQFWAAMLINVEID